MELDIAVEAGWPLPTSPAPPGLALASPGSAPATPHSPRDWEALATAAADAAASVASELDHPRLVASILFTDDEDIRALNSEWRGKDKPTNVLSFPMLERAELLALAEHGPPELLGDIALALETCAREAAGKGITLDAHAAHLIIHGLLHLAGHDHETSEADAEAMEALEIRALALIGLDNPYDDRP